MILFLLGMPGSGKSTLGKLLSQHTGWSFSDLDQLIVKQEGASIPEIFNQKGESYFRNLESKFLNELDADQNLVLATGGGSPCYNNNMSVLNEKGKTIFLDPPLSILEKRLVEEGISKRPLLPDTQEELLPFLEGLYEKRLPFYQQATMRIADEKGSLDSILSLLY